MDGAAWAEWCAGASRIRDVIRPLAMEEPEEQELSSLEGYRRNAERGGGIATGDP